MDVIAKGTKKDLGFSNLGRGHNDGLLVVLNGV